MSDLTLDEQKHVRVALRILRLRLDGWKAVGDALHFSVVTVSKVVNGANPVTAIMAFRVARLTGVTVDDLLTGKYAPEGTCPHCGRSISTFTDETTVP